MIGLAQDFDVHPNQIKQLLAGASGVFADAPKAGSESTIDVKTLHARIWELTLGNNFCPARPAGGGCCRAQKDDRSCCAARRQPPGHRPGDQPEQGFLSAPPGVERRSETEASDRQAAHGIPLRGQPDVAGAVGSGRVQDRAVALGQSDETHGN